MIMDAVKREFLANLDAELAVTGEPAAGREPVSRAGKSRSKTRARVAATAVAATLFGALVAVNPPPAAASSGNCLQPDFEMKTHYKVCSSYAVVKHRYDHDEVSVDGDVIYECYVFYSSYRSTCAETDFWSKACK